VAVARIILGCALIGLEELALCLLVDLLVNINRRRSRWTSFFTYDDLSHARLSQGLMTLILLGMRSAIFLAVNFLHVLKKRGGREMK
jgi:hypothetical protein